MEQINKLLAEHEAKTEAATGLRMAVHAYYRLERGDFEEWVCNKLGIDFQLMDMESDSDHVCSTYEIAESIGPDAETREAVFEDDFEHMMKTGNLPIHLVGNLIAQFCDRGELPEGYYIINSGW